MANLGKKGGIFHIRFRFRGKEYKKSLKIRDKIHAEAAKKVTELTIHRLLTGQITLPTDVDAGDFIFSGGTLTKPLASPAKAISRRRQRTSRPVLRAPEAPYGSLVSLQPGHAFEAFPAFPGRLTRTLLAIRFPSAIWIAI